MMVDTIQPILQANGVNFRFPQKQVFSNFSASLPAGITYITGDESSGKSTLLRLLAGDLTAQAGDVAINSISSTKDLASYRKLVFWTDPRTTAHDQISPNDPNFDEFVLADMIQSLSLTEHVAKEIFKLSAGSKRKVWLAAAFASGAAVTLLGEPFAALDQASIGYLLDRLETYAQNKQRAWVIADYGVPQDLSTILTINLDV
jgi:ABC-type cobalamin/Fe3+-siderophores transport system ATPase subunit